MTIVCQLSKQQHSNNPASVTEREREQTERDVNPDREIRKSLGTYSPIIKQQSIEAYPYGNTTFLKQAKEKKHSIINAEIALFTLFSATPLTSKAS